MIWGQVQVAWKAIPLILLAACAAPDSERVPDSRSPGAAETRQVEESKPSPVERKEPFSLPEPLFVNDAIRIALKMSPNLDAARERINAAHERITQSRAGYWPTIDLTASATRVQSSPGLFTFPGLDSRYESYEAGLSANWLLFDGLAREARITAGESGWQESLLAHDDMKRLLIQAVHLACNNVFLARERMRIGDADAKFNARLVEETRHRFDAGSASLSECLNFEIRHNAALSSLITARDEEETALAVLAELMGVPESVPRDNLDLAPLEEAKEIDLALPDVEEELVYALAHRPDLERLHHAICAAEARVQEGEAANLPSVFVQAFYGFQRTDNPHFDLDDDNSAQASLNVAWNLFSGLADSAVIKEATAQSRVLESELAALWLTVVSEVRQKVTRLGSVQEQLALQRRNEELSREARDLVRKEYQAGQATLTRLNEAQRDLVTAEGNLSLARILLRQAWNDLDAVTSRNLAKFN